jgi:sarcosine oxidase subunit alpha
MKIALIQMNLAWCDAAANLHRAEEMMKSTPGADVYVLPEMFTTGFCMEPERIAEPAEGSALQWMRRVAGEMDAAVAGSVATIAPDGGYRNRMYFVTPDGQVTHYDKRHLFSYSGEDKHYEAGAERVIVLDRDDAPGGILQQCIHNGFGLHRFKEELTGPEYAQRFVDKAEELDVQIRCGTMVVELTPKSSEADCIVVTTMSRRYGLEEIRAKSVVLAMGCRERPRGALMTPGTRPAGVYTAGTVQRLVNMDGIMPGKRVVILGSGDIGLIMARRLTFQGAKVLACVEIMHKSSGLMRNVVQCLNDFDIPLLLRHTVVGVEGREHVTGVKVAKVDEDLKPIQGTEIHFDCDTLLLSCGLIPENELSKIAGVEIDPKSRGPKVDGKMATSVPGIFAGGNVVKVYDLVDWVSRDSEIAGRSAAEYAKGVGK